MPLPDQLYLHVPFCNGKCRYCGFYSVAYTPDRADTWLRGLAQELAGAASATAAPLVPETIYVGGGTPSILGAPELTRLQALLRQYVDLTRLAEWTVEANPGTLDAHKLDLLRAAGVNRISFGVQATDDAVLRTIGRRHTAADLSVSVDHARRAGFTNVGLDLIAGLPGVSDAAWDETLRAITALAPTHVSVYALSVEPTAPWHADVASGRIALPPETAQIEALAAARTHLERAGFERYEISNYARPGQACRHNTAVWRGGDYLGFGPAAASRHGRQRWTNTPDLEAYGRALAAGQRPPAEERETLSLAADAGERIAFAFRLAEGVTPAAYVPPGEPVPAHWTAALAELAAQGLLVADAGRWRLTERGWDCADTIAAAFIA